MTAHITKTKDGYELYISPTDRAADYTTLYIRVGGKSQARELAKRHNAKPWNF